MERLKQMKETLMSVVQGQMGNLGQVDTQELGEAIDMIKDLSEATYYCTIVKAMEEQDKEKEVMKKYGKQHYYSPMYYPYPPDINYYHDRDMDRGIGRMYYSGGNSSGSNSSSSSGGSSNSGSSGSNGSYDASARGNNARGGGTRGYSEREFPVDMMNMRDVREGRAPMARRSYMESKEMHKDKNSKIKELEKYMQDLGQDIIEMIQDASPEEKQTLEKKISSLASKVAQLNA